MMAFTLVSLMLSLFGGIFAALSAFRNYTDTDIRDRCNRQEIHLKDLEARSQVDPNQGLRESLTKAKKFAATMKSARRYWTYSQLVPTVLFLSFALFMSTWALLNWGELNSPQNWNGWKVIIGSGMAVDILSLILMVFAWVRLRSASDDLDSHVGTVVSLTAGIRADPPT